MRAGRTRGRTGARSGADQPNATIHPLDGCGRDHPHRATFATLTFDIHTYNEAAAMSDHPLDELIDDIKARPVPYATLAAAGVAAALLLAARSLPNDRPPVRETVERTAAGLGERLAETRDRLSTEEDVASVRERAGTGRDAVMVLIGTVLSTGLAGWMRRRDQQRAGSPGATPAEADGHAPDERLSELTVPELRTIATERDIPGRSSMNKGELVDALATD